MSRIERLILKIFSIIDFSSLSVFIYSKRYQEVYRYISYIFSKIGLDPMFTDKSFQEEIVDLNSFFDWILLRTSLPADSKINIKNMYLDGAEKLDVYITYLEFLLRQREKKKKKVFKYISKLGDTISKEVTLCLTELNFMGKIDLTYSEMRELLSKLNLFLDIQYSECTPYFDSILKTINLTSYRIDEFLHEIIHAKFAEKCKSLDFYLPLKFNNYFEYLSSEIELECISNQYLFSCQNITEGDVVREITESLILNDISEIQTEDRRGFLLKYYFSPIFSLYEKEEVSYEELLGLIDRFLDKLLFKHEYYFKGA